MFKNVRFQPFLLTKIAYMANMLFIFSVLITLSISCCLYFCLTSGRWWRLYWYVSQWFLPMNCGQSLIFLWWVVSPVSFCFRLYFHVRQFAVITVVYCVTQVLACTFCVEFLICGCHHRCPWSLLPYLVCYTYMTCG